MFLQGRPKRGLPGFQNGLVLGAERMVMAFGDGLGDAGVSQLGIVALQHLPD